MKIHIPAFEAMAKCNEHLNHGPIDIDLGDDVVSVVRCKDCVHWMVSMDKLSTWCSKLSDKETTEYDYCSFGERKLEG